MKVNIQNISSEIESSSLVFTKTTKKQESIEAVRMDKGFSVNTIVGELRGKIGDYLVKTAKGEVLPMSKEEFETKYNPIN